MARLRATHFVPVFFKAAFTHKELAKQLSVKPKYKTSPLECVLFKYWQKIHQFCKCQLTKCW